MQYVSNFFGGYQKVDGQQDQNYTMDEMGNDTSSSMGNMNMGSYSSSSSSQFQQHQQQDEPMNSFAISTISTSPYPQGPITNDNSIYINNQQQYDPNSPQSSSTLPLQSEKTWFSSLWPGSSPSSSQIDEMSTMYDVESQTTIQQSIQHEQSMPIIQRWAINSYNKVSKHLPDVKLPELTYTQKLTSFILFALGGLILLLNALMNLTSIFLGGSSKFALTLSVANIFFIMSSLFITSPSSHFTPNRRFTTFLYLGTIIATVLASAYLPYAIVVLPILAAQLAALGFHILSFFTSAVNVNMNIGQSIVTSMFRQAL